MLEDKGILRLYLEFVALLIALLFGVLAGQLIYEFIYKSLIDCLASF